MGRGTPLGLGVVAGAWLAGWWVPDVLLAAALAALAAAATLARPTLARLLGLGLTLGLVATASQPIGPWQRGPAAFIGRVASAPSGGMVTLAVEATRQVGPWQPAAGRIALVVRGAAPRPGQRVVAAGEAVRCVASGPPGAPDLLRGLRRARVRTCVEAPQWAAIADPIHGGGERRAVDPAVPGLLMALATGDRSRVDPATTGLLRRTGTSHLLAISGFHVGLVAGAAAAGAALARGLLALLQPAGVAAGAAWAGGAAGGALFAWAVGLPVSAQRAAAMVGLVALARTLGRPLVASDAVALAAAAIATFDPAAVSGASFQLSFGAVVGLLTWGPALGAPPHAGRVRAWVQGALAASTAATIGTLPAAAWWFQALPTGSLPANVVAMPLTAFVLVPLAFASVYAPAPLADLAARLGGPAVEVFLATLRPFDLPILHPAVGPVGAVALTAVLALPRQPVLAALIALTVLHLKARPAGDLVVTAVDVGQGDATLLEWPDGEAWLVDTGGHPSALGAWLRRRGRPRIHRLILTHADRDHVGGLEGVLDAARVDVLEVPARPPTSPQAADGVVARLRTRGPPGAPVPADPLARAIEAAEAAGVRVLDAPGLRVWPDGPCEGSRNRCGLVRPIVRGGLRLLFPGDVPADVEAGLLVSSGLVGPIDLLHLGHHGAPSSSSVAWLRALRPAVAVAGVGAGNRYGHPHPAVQRRLKDLGIPLLRTDTWGTVQLRLRPDGIAVRATRAAERGVMLLPQSAPQRADGPAAPPTPPPPGPPTRG